MNMETELKKNYSTYFFVIIIIIGILTYLWFENNKNKTDNSLFQLCLMTNFIGFEKDSQIRQMAYDCVGNDYGNSGKVISCFNIASPNSMNLNIYNSCKKN